MLFQSINRWRLFNSTDLQLKPQLSEFLWSFCSTSNHFNYTPSFWPFISFPWPAHQKPINFYTLCWLLYSVFFFCGAQQFANSILDRTYAYRSN